MLVRKTSDHVVRAASVEGSPTLMKSLSALKGLRLSPAKGFTVRKPNIFVARINGLGHFPRGLGPLDNPLGLHL